MQQELDIGFGRSALGAPGVLGIWGEGLFIFRELSWGALLIILGELGSKHILLGV